ncbi:hypothetical protein BG60_33630 [Caballeronia zhejiangensis]|uniref:Uncharacterized protein n=1 Tax=Caballeronia zhejiangensis TaxID=871203 RepID=A0A656Q944_9BURK|nr:hypothetical protein BG60_33630 [Caballeronia zhejiangensis]
MPMSRSSTTNRPTTCKPPRGTLARYRERIVEVLGEARGQRVMIRSVHADGAEGRTAVKPVNLLPLDSQLF